MCLIFMANYSFSGRRRLIDSETLLVTDFVNLKINSAQSFKSVYRDMVYVYIFIWVSTHICMCIYICTMFLKKDSATTHLFRNRKHSEYRNLCIPATTVLPPRDFSCRSRKSKKKATCSQVCRDKKKTSVGQSDHQVSFTHGANLPHGAPVTYTCLNSVL
jgi:hypothetical protein